MLSWELHISQIGRVQHACNQGITPLMSQNNLKMIYYSYVHSITTYGIIFGRNVPHSTDFLRFRNG